MTTMTIHVEDDFAEALRAHARAVGTSVNRAVKEMLSPLLGLSKTGTSESDNPYMKFCGILRKGEADRLRDSVARQRTIDAGTQGETARAREEREAFSELLAMPNVSVLPVTRTTGSFYARVFAYSHSVGRPIPTNDVWIAAAVLETAGILCTDDRHLLSLPLVRTIRYR